MQLPENKNLFDTLLGKDSLFLAPMDGYSDFPFRRIAKSTGANILYSEFINALDVINGHPFLKQLTYFENFERPFAYQIFDDSPERILHTAKILAKNEPDFIDINLGCSAKTVSSRGAGAGLLRTPEKVKLIFKLLKKNIHLPITAKIRLGWDDDNLNYLEIGDILQDYGASMVAVHGRTKKQGYSGAADWDKIAEVKSRLTIPVIANGDVRTVDDIDKIRYVTDCDGVMIGRAALKNPWIFQRKNLHEVDFSTRWQVLKQHLNHMLDFYGNEVGLILFRKHLKNYLDVPSLKKEDRRNLFTQTSAESLLRLTRPVLELKVALEKQSPAPI